MDRTIGTFKASLIASLIATLVWAVGLADKIWPAHPFFLVFLVALVGTYVIRYWNVPMGTLFSKSRS